MRARSCSAGKPASETRTALRRRQVGYVQQKPYLMKMSVRDNIGLGLKFRGETRGAVDAAVNAVAGELGLTALLDRDAGKLSGGEIQKVALAPRAGAATRRHHHG